MAGNEYYPTRPKEEQDRTRIAAGSPLAVVGIYLEAFRELFREENAQPFVWRPDDSVTDISIEAGYNVNVEGRNEGRAIYVNRTSTVPTQVAIGDRAGVRLTDHYEGFMVLMQSSMSIDCVSTRAGESMLLGDIVQHFCIASKRIFEAQYAFHSMGLAQLGQTAPYIHDQERFATPVTFDVTYTARWSTVKIRPLLAEVAVRMGSEEEMVAAARASLSRSPQWYSEPDKCEEP